MLIESPANPRVRAALALRERGERERTGLTLVDGGREALRAVLAGVRIEAAFACEARLRSDDARAAVEALGRRGVALSPVGPRVSERLAYGDRDDGLVLVVEAPRARRLGDLPLGDPAFIIVTEDVEKPGNLGAVLRTADGVGADAVVVIGGTDPGNPNVIRASAGTVFSVPLATGEAIDVAARLRELGIRIVATRPDAPRPVWEADLRGPVAIVLGSEAHGLGSAWRATDIEAVHLPMRGAADSLNVAATAAIACYEVRRQRDIAAG